MMPEDDWRPKVARLPYLPLLQVQASMGPKALWEPVDLPRAAQAAADNTACSIVVWSEDLHQVLQQEGQPDNHLSAATSNLGASGKR